MTPSITGLPYDPRDGDIEPAEWCFEHEQRKENCGPCNQADIDRELFERELEKTVPKPERPLFRSMLERMRMTSDEIMGAALAARFQTKESE